MTCIVNFGSEPVALPAGEPLVVSADTDDDLPPDAAAWVAPPVR
jgi:hypothetical protein